jgi:hypothetical protein
MNRIFLATLLLVSASLYAATTIITTNASTGPGSLYQSVADANSGDTILFNLPVGQDTIVLLDSLLIDKDLTIDGENLAGSGVRVVLEVDTVANFQTLDPASQYVMFHVNDASLNLSNFILRGGKTYREASIIYAQGSSSVEPYSTHVSVKNILVYETYAKLGSAYYGENTYFELNNSQLLNILYSCNTGNCFGGAIRNKGRSIINQSILDTIWNIENTIDSALGAAIYSEGSLFINASTIMHTKHRTTSPTPTGFAAGAGVATRGSANILNSTFFYNAIEGFSSEMYGAAIYAEGQLTLVSNSFQINILDGSPGYTPSIKGGAIYSLDTSILINNAFSSSGVSLYGDYPSLPCESNFVSGLYWNYNSFDTPSSNFITLNNILERDTCEGFLYPQIDLSVPEFSNQHRSWDETFEYLYRQVIPYENILDMNPAWPTPTTKLTANSPAKGSGLRVGSYFDGSTTQYDAYMTDSGWVSARTSQLVSGVTEITTDQRGVSMWGPRTIGSVFVPRQDFRTISDGAWTDTLIWEIKTGENTWSPTSQYPDYESYGASLITISHDITLDTNLNTSGITLTDSASITLGTDDTLFIEDNLNLDIDLTLAGSVNAFDRIIAKNNAMIDWQPQNPIIITTNASTGPGSLAEAILKYNSGDTILFNLPAGQDTIVLLDSLLIDKDLTIDGENSLGSGNNITLSTKYPYVHGYIDSLTTHSLISIEHSSLTMSNFTLLGGAAVTEFGATSRPGGLIYAKGNKIGNSYSCNVELNNLTVPTTQSNYGSAYLGDTTSVKISNSKFTHLYAVCDSTSNCNGGVINNIGELSIAQSIIDSNWFAAHYSDTATGGTIYSDGVLKISETSFIRNQMNSQSNSTDLMAGGVLSFNGKATVSNSTFYDNSIDAIVGEIKGGAIYSNGALTLKSNTFVFNVISSREHWSGTWYGVADVQGADVFINTPSAVMLNNLFAQSLVQYIDPFDSLDNPQACPAGTNSYSYNYSVASNSALIVGNNNFFSENYCPSAPKYSSPPELVGNQNLYASYLIVSKYVEPFIYLGDYGGPTPTIKLSPSSVAIGTGLRVGSYNDGSEDHYDAFMTDSGWTSARSGQLVSGVTELTTDQRGVEIWGPPSIGSYFRPRQDFRTISDGAWTDSTIWEIKTGANTWSPASQYPDYESYGASLITISHDITLDTNVNISGVTLADSASIALGTDDTLFIKDNLNLAVDMLINGIVNLPSNVISLDSASIIWSGTDQTITFTPLPDSIKTGETIILEATSTSGLPVLFSLSDSSLATLTGDSLFFNSNGTLEIFADQSGNINFNPADQVSQVILVYTEGPVAINFNPANFSEGNWKVYDVLGNQVGELNNLYQLNQNQLNPGIYFIRNDKSESLKIRIPESK